MKNNVSKIFALMLAILITISMMCISVSAIDYDESDATSFTFTDDGITAQDGAYTGYEIDGTNLSIKKSGTYIVSGSCSDGTITIKKGTTGVVLILNNLNLTSKDTAPVACNKSSEVTIVAKSGSVNTLTDNAYNNDDNYPENTNAENAVIKCKDGSKVTIGGSGTINIVSNGKNGIKSGSTTDTEGEAYLNIEDVTLNITATVNDAINAESTLNILSGNIEVSSADDGIHSDYYLNIGAENTDGPTIIISKAYEGIEGATLNIYSGNIEVHAEEDGINAANGDVTDYTFELNIYDGNIYVDAETGDGIDSNGTLNIEGGKIEVFSASSSDNTPLDSETGIILKGGTVFAIGSSGMAESPKSGGQQYITFGGSGFGGGMMPNNTMNNQGQAQKEMNGQTPPKRPEGETPSGDMGTPPQMNGQRPTDMNMGGQNGNSSISVKAGDEIKILDSSKNVIYSNTALRDADYILFSSANLNENETYTLTINDEETTAIDNSNIDNNQQLPNQNQEENNSANEDTESDTSINNENVTESTETNINTNTNTTQDDVTSAIEKINTSTGNNAKSEEIAESSDTTNNTSSNNNDNKVVSTNNSQTDTVATSSSANPHTGVESNIIIILSVAAAALIGITGTGIIIKKRKGRFISK